jgi:Zn-dependent peptidase ImmA (M78 family)
MNYSWIDEYVDGIIEYCNSRDIYEIYDFLDIKIIKLQNDNILLHNSDALYHRNYFDEEVVFIRNDLPYQYEKFVLAHELGHALLHTETCSAAFKRNLINKGKLERQANYFALKLLNIEIHDTEHEGYTLEQIARTLYIPKECLQHFL